jgi:hypothetical protein
MPASVQQIVSDPEFAKLSADDQAAVVAHFDSDFLQVPDDDKAAVIQHLQRQAVSRPDLAAPPSAARPQVEMEQWGGDPRPTAGLPGSSPNPYSAGPGYTAAVGLPLAAAGGYAAIAGGPAGYGLGYATEAVNAMLKAHPAAAQALKVLAKGALYGGGFTAGAHAVAKHVLNLLGGSE